MLVPCTRPLCTLTRAGLGRCPGPLSPFRGWSPSGGALEPPPPTRGSVSPARSSRPGRSRDAPAAPDAVRAGRPGAAGGEAGCQDGAWGAGSEGLGPGPGQEAKEDHEERVLAMLGIAGTVLNLLVIIFVYVYTTV
ncbi:unnamed protein product [Lepidochelys kempii]